MKVFATHIVVVLGLAGVMTVSGEELEYGSSPVHSSSEALDLALQYTGFTDLVEIDRDRIGELVETVKVEDTTTPFLADSIDGRTVWQIKLRGLVLHLKYTRGASPAAHAKDAVVTIDSLTGRVVEIRLQDSGKDVGDKYELGSEVAAREIGMVGGEAYLGFPDVPPHLSFLKVLDTEGMMGSPLVSDLTVGNYVMHYIYGSDTLAAWIVHMHGNTPFRGPGQTHWRNVVDATSGRLIHVINRPGSK